jgi:3-dehydroquinate dehydratase/shikimate dehydrogenase
MNLGMNMGSMLFGVIPGPSLLLAERLLEQVRPLIDGIELRLDYFETIDLAGLKRFVETCGLPVMFTVRRNDQGGRFLGTEEERLKLIESLCALQPAYVDLEYDVAAEFRKKLFETYREISFLSSYHDFTQTPADLDAIYEQIKTPHAHVFKIAVAAKSTIDALRLLTFIQEHSKREKWIGISMGEEGTITRLLAPVVGCVLTYAAIGSDHTAPGQMTAQEMQQIYRFRKLNSQTGIYGVIGDPVDKSLGHLAHNAVFDQQNLNAIYLRMGVKTPELQAFFSLVRQLPFHGLSVTMPHKAAVIPYLTEISIQARVVQACNTIHMVEGKWIGYNTDGMGALNALEKREFVFGKHLVFIGAGGAARALVLEAADRGAYVTVINRHPEKAKELATLLKGQGGGWDLLPQVCARGYDVIINCIPNSEMIEEEWILPEKIAMDIVYIPKNTPFLLKAAQKKCRIVFGYEMFAGQAVEQLRIWFADSVDVDKAYLTIEEKVMSALT